MKFPDNGELTPPFIDSGHSEMIRRLRLGSLRKLFRDR